MAADDQVPSADELIRPGIDRLVELRPNALRHINEGEGVYSHIFVGWRAQAAIMCRRLADLAKQGRLKFSEDQFLRFLADSEFASLPDESPKAAIGQAVLTRDPGRVGGSIRKGDRFNRPADTSSSRLWTDAAYTCEVDTHVPQGATTVTVPLVAARAGSFANRPNIGAVPTELEIADDIVDRAAWTVQSYEMGGGSDAVVDDDVRRFALAYSLGQSGPTDKAAIAGALQAGAKHAISVDDPSIAAERLYVADPSWGGSTRWAASIRQSLYDNKFIGFGCKVLVASFVNQVIGIEASVRLRSPSYSSETSSVDVAIQKALRSYFDDRQDFNRWSLTALKGVISRADRRISLCTSVAVKDLNGATVSPPMVSAGVHYLLVANACSITYLSPI